MTLQDYAKHALLLSETIPCNASGVVFSFSNWMRFACDSGLDQKARNNHPITKGYMIGLCSLLGNPNDDMTSYGDSVDALKSLIESKEASAS
jgi:hypothetical protein